MNWNLQGHYEVISTVGEKLNAEIMNLGTELPGM